MLTPFQLNQLSQPVINIYSQLENDILKAIAERLKTDKDVTKDNVLKWQFEKLQALGDLNKDVIKLISTMSGVAEQEINALIENSGTQSIQDMEKYLKKLSDDGKIKQAPPVNEDPRIFSTLLNFQRQARQNINLVNSSILQNSKQVYRDIISKAVASVMTGFKTHQQALADSSAEWADKGIPALIDKAGHHWSIEGYIPLVTRTISNNIANQAQWSRMDSYDLDLIEVSSHLGARPLCAPYQGHIFSRNGNSSKYPALSSTSYGKAAGLFGCNCRHVSYPYIPGVSRKTYSPYPAAENAAVYAQSQQQRYLERQIRKSKTKLDMMKALDNEKGIAKANTDVRNNQAQLREFIKQTGRTRRYEREQIMHKPDDELLKQHQNDVTKKQQQIRDKIKSGAISTQINPEKQARHMVGDPAYEAYKKNLSAKGTYGPSYLTINDEEVQQLINKHAGTGKLMVDDHLNFKNQEIIVQNGKKIGYYVDKDGNEHATGNFEIRYSKTGVHVFPTKVIKDESK
jgi:hypothetical protein